MSEYLTARQNFERQIAELHEGTLETFSFSDSSGNGSLTLSTGDLEKLTKALATNTTLEGIHLRFDSTLDEIIEALAPALRAHSNIRWITVNDSNGRITDKGVRALAEACAGHPTIECLNIDQYKPGLNPETVDSLVRVIQQTPKLVRLMVTVSRRDVGANQHDEALSTILNHAALTPKSRRNLLEIHPTFDAQNNDESLRHANWNMCASILRAVGTDREKPIPVHILCAASPRMPALRRIAAGLQEERRKDIKRSLSTFAPPPLPSDMDGSLVLPHPETGLSYLDNPEFWEQLETASIPLTKQQLMTPNRDGNPSLISGVACGKTAVILNALHQQGEQLTPADLLDENGNPNALLDAICYFKATTELFTIDNWMGQRAQDASNVLRAMPQEAQERVPNAHTLIAQLTRHHASQSQGRA